MRRIALLFSFCCCLALPASARTSVKLADVARLSPKQQSSLRDAEFELSQARIAWAGARERQKQARSVYEDAKRRLKPAELDVKAARMEQKAAKAGEATERMAAAAAALAGAKNDRETVELLVRWREKEFKAARLEAEELQTRIELSEARLELGRIHALIAEQLPAAEKYSLAEFEKRAAGLKKSYDRAQDKTRRMTAEAAELQIAWTQRSGAADSGYSVESRSMRQAR